MLGWDVYIAPCAVRLIALPLLAPRLILAAYQVFSQPIFYFSERTVGARLSTVSAWMFRLSFRSAYVVLVAFISICLPFFSDIVGLIGAIGFWPATVFYPVEVRTRRCSGG